ncbi:phosphatidylglycerophosphatase A [Sulfurimonas sp.]|jgi:phosphatidylglycerophosphatase A|uniref:phosphatidylglycerophosphatase A family protein n=1 Tax=Sulfurimonas sp. TaxID=2022749 RepID=UPI0025FC75CD|nr:phosphatidylglycerophosphatase A [Sulfurimonas sp.]MBT5934258.1 phosphatidylglycerophosphatase A [Sulfurimonas sp.]
MNYFFITLFYSGLAPKAPGTIGTLVAFPLGLFILIYLDASTLFLATLLITLVAIKSINKYELETGSHDDKRIVIDELVGMWFALSIAPAIGVTFEEISDLSNGFLIQALLSFALFRYFDIAKPSIIGRIDRDAKGGIGVMGDDIVAGFAAGIASSSLWQGYFYLQTFI